MSDSLSCCFDWVCKDCLLEVMLKTRRVIIPWMSACDFGSGVLTPFCPELGLRLFDKETDESRRPCGGFLLRPESCIWDFIFLSASRP